MSDRIERFIDGLTSEQTVELATRALQSLGTENACDAIFAALDDADLEELAARIADRIGGAA